jgi:APA family basic amino acid/polyamine antiporter
VWPGFGKRVIAGAVAVSAFGVLNAQLLSGPRLVYGMARDGRFFKAFGELRRGTPVAAIVMMAVVALALLLVSSVVSVEFDAKLDVIGMLGTGAVFIDCVFFILTGVAVFVLRQRDRVEGAFRMPGYPIVPALFVIGEAGALIGAYMDKETARVAWVGVAWILAAGVLYAARFRRKAT